MSEIKIKTETLPYRCDICHQADQFDQATGKCLRCVNVNESIDYSNERIELRYNLTARDSLNFQLYALPRKRGIQIIYGSLLLFVGYLTFITCFMVSLFPRLLISVTVSLFWLLLLIGIISVLLYFQAKAKKNKTRLTDYKLIVSDKFLIEESSYKRDQYNWNAVQQISQNKKYIHIFDSESSAILIPKRCFANKDEETRFYNFITAMWKKTS